MTTSQLENTIISAARQHMAEIVFFDKNPGEDQFHERQGAYYALHALLELFHVEGSGLSDAGIKALYEIEQEFLVAQRAYNDKNIAA